MPYAYISFCLDSFQINNTRSWHLDTDYASLALNISSGGAGGQNWSWTKPMGDLNNGTYPVGVSIGPIPISPDETAVMNYLIVNSGYQTPSAVEQTILSTAQKLAAAGAGAAGGFVPGIGPVLGVVLAGATDWLISNLESILFADCDGTVAAEQEKFAYNDLLAKTTLAGYYGQSVDNPGTNSPSGCGSNSDYVVNWHLARENVRTFQALGAQTVLMLESDGSLWLGQAPFGTVPQPIGPGPGQRLRVDGNVRTFSALSTTEVLVLGTNGALWLEQGPFGTQGPPARHQVDGNVRAFQASDAQNVFVLGNDGNLWLEQGPFGTVPLPVGPGPSHRQQVDGFVRSFQEIDAQHVLVLGTDGALWLEQGPFGSVPPSRQQVDGEVAAFQHPYMGQGVYVLGTDGKLWLEQPPFGTVPLPVGPGSGHRLQVDGQVQSFRPVDQEHVFVLGTDGSLWLEQGPFGTVPLPTGPGPSHRLQVDVSVWDYRLIDADHVLVLGSDGNLWLEQAPFGTAPPQSRTLIDVNVA